MTAFLCLNCFYKWNGDVGSRCSRCHSRIVVEEETFMRAVESVKKVKDKIDSPTSHVTLDDAVNAINDVTDVTGKFRGRPLIVRKVRQRILREAGVARIKRLKRV